MHQTIWFHYGKMCISVKDIVKDRMKRCYQDNGQIKGAWMLAKKVVWIHVSDKPLPGSHKDKAWEGGSPDFQDSVTITLEWK